jgi:hypothetical protein
MVESHMNPLPLPPSRSGIMPALFYPRGTLGRELHEAERKVQVASVGGVWRELHPGEHLTDTVTRRGQGIQGVQRQSLLGAGDADPPGAAVGGLAGAARVEQ